jgi:hypothetical protein
MDPWRPMTAPGYELTEAEFQHNVCEAADILHWDWTHTGSGRTSKGWRVPMRGPIAEGFPDLFLSNQKDGRIIWAELKTNRGKLTARQEFVLDRLRNRYAKWHGFITVAVWRPRDWDVIEEILQ